MIDAHTASVQIGETQQKLPFNQSQQGITLFQNGQSYKFAYIRQDFNQADSQADEGHLKAPMPGVVTQVLVSANHSVKKDDILMTLEAMKMEYTIRAPKDGVIVDPISKSVIRSKLAMSLWNFSLHRRKLHE